MINESKTARGSIAVSVFQQDPGDEQLLSPVSNVPIRIYHAPDPTDTKQRYNQSHSWREYLCPVDLDNFEFVGEGRTDSSGKLTQIIDPGHYIVSGALDSAAMRFCNDVNVDAGCTADACFRLQFALRLSALKRKHECDEPESCAVFATGRPMVLRIEGDRKFLPAGTTAAFRVGSTSFGTKTFDGKTNTLDFGVVAPSSLGTQVASADMTFPGGAAVGIGARFETEPGAVQEIGGQIGVTLKRTATPPTADQALWIAIRNRTKAIAFSGSGYADFIDKILCQQTATVPNDKGGAALTRKLAELGSHVYGVGAYELLKTATEIFLLLECGVVINQAGAFSTNSIFDPLNESARLGEAITLTDARNRLAGYLGGNKLPYIDRVLRVAFPDEGETDRVHCTGILSSRAASPCLLELIWSYWNEEGMLVQTLNAISRRFQNVRGPGDRDPLAHLEIDPLRPLNNILWGYIQDEQNRLTVKRRAYEYDHHYGLTIYGKAVPALRSADSRSKFVEGFHNFLHLCSIFYKEDNDTTVIADGFPLLNGLKEVHLLLAQGAHNQFGDLPWTARVEMLIQQWLLARPEMRDFLQSRPMVPYQEAWMPQVDTMKTLQGWSDVTITHFRDLAVYGEQILLSIRYGDWIDINLEDSAKNWARYWRPEIQGYLHAYRAATGIDLTNPDTVDYSMPALHLKKRLALQRVR